ncbi:hypothetical protein [Kitasatospora sp. A2-31]|uniref:hypothetical protein n=1 Tax=Kitasatospora sp. A2-31 TaxID=2916414 RepID=UPI001EE9C67B|nr:hypothetical protein [Kitasatospora sp. A2-31]MCG6496874.1 hypothetical protein [Kitasatospora sp. A2-31]
MAEAVPEAGRQAITATWPRAEIAQILAATDGVSGAVDDYGLYSWTDLAASCRADGPQALVDAVHRAEEQDAHGRTWPRYKPSDDKALAHLDLTADGTSAG